MIAAHAGLAALSAAVLVATLGACAHRSGGLPADRHLSPDRPQDSAPAGEGARGDDPRPTTRALPVPGTRFEDWPVLDALDARPGARLVPHPELVDPVPDVAEAPPPPPPGAQEPLRSHTVAQGPDAGLE